MKIYTGKSIDDMREVKLIDIIAESYSNNTEFKVSVDCFSDESASWVSIVSENEKESKELTILFNGSGTKIAGTQLHVTPIKRVLIDDETVKVF